MTAMQPETSFGHIRRNSLRGFTLVRRAFRQPDWSLAHLRGYGDKLIDQLRKQEETSFESTSLEDAIERITKAKRASIGEILQNVPKPRAVRESVLYGIPDGSSELVSLVYAICRLTSPQIVVETGVANGFTTAAVLQALLENDKGVLQSIDLPHLHPNAVASIGAAVQPCLRDRWMLHLGPAELMLPRVLRTLPEIDIFIQDASHSIRGQLVEYRHGWPRIMHGGILVSDDVGIGFSRFAAEVGVEPIYITQPKEAPIGVLVKP
jgi:predicted O-methyltransferase YrrM